MIITPTNNIYDTLLMSAIDKDIIMELLLASQICDNLHKKAF